MENDVPEKSVQAPSSPSQDPRISSEKEQAIREAYDRGGHTSLFELSISAGGLLNDSLRKLVWPVLLGDDQAAREVTAVPPQLRDWRELPRHKDEDQVELDVKRSFVFYPLHESDDALELRRVDLSDAILEVLRRHPYLCYFQGYHDIVQVFLLVLGKDLCVGAVSRLSLLRIRDFMLPSLAPSVAHLQLLPPILYAADRTLYQHLSTVRPYFALAATLTLYAHEVQDYSDIARLFDFLLAQEAVVSIYFFAQIILTRKKELLEIPADDSEMLHFTLSKLPKPLDLEDLISRTLQLIDEHPPRRLPWGAWRKISHSSVLKTTSPLGRTGGARAQAFDMTLGDFYFQKQLHQLNRDERWLYAKMMLWRHRWSIGGTGLAIMIGLVSVWLQRHGDSGATIFLSRHWRRIGHRGGY